MKAGDEIRDLIERHPHYQAYRMIAAHDYRQWFEETGFSDAYATWHGIARRLVAFAMTRGVQIAEQLRNDYTWVCARMREHEYLRLYLVVRDRDCVRASNLFRVMQWREWRPDRIVHAEQVEVVAEEGTGRLTCISFVHPGIRNSQGDLLSKPQVRVVREASRPSGAGPSRPHSETVSTAPAPRPTTVEPLSPEAQHMGELLPTLKGLIDSMGMDRGARYREMFEPYLAAAESSAPPAATLNALANMHNVMRFLSLLDAVGGSAELEQALGVERLPLPDLFLRPVDLADFEVVEASGAGDRFRVVREVSPGYRIVKSGRVIRKPKVEVQAQ